MAASAILSSVNPSVKLALAEATIEYYQSQMAELENQMDIVVSMKQDDQGTYALEEEAKLRTQIESVRAAIGFWRTEASFWRNEVQENKTALKDSNKLAASS
jgi:hypothetical protein